MSRREMEQYLRQLEKRGYTRKRGGSKHWKIYMGDLMVASGASSPSDPRSIKNLKAEIKRYEKRVANERSRADEIHQGHGTDSEPALQ